MNIHIELQNLKLPGLDIVNSMDRKSDASDFTYADWEKIFFNSNALCGTRMDKTTPQTASGYLLQFNRVPPNFFKPKDDCSIDVYMNDKELDSSFVSSDFFNSGFKLPTSFFRIGINAEYTNTKVETSEARIKYFTCCYSVSRVKIELKSNYFEPTDKFLEAINAALNLKTKDDKYNGLQQVFSDYGHVYSTEIVLGGHLYYRESYKLKTAAEEHEKRLEVSAKVSSAINKLANVRIGGMFSTQEKYKAGSSEQESKVRFQAIGGDTIKSQYPDIWAETVKDPFLWRVIQRDGFEPVIKLLSEEKQEQIRKIFETGKIHAIVNSYHQETLLKYL